MDRVRSSLRRRVPLDEREASAIAETLAETERLVAPLDRHSDPVHVTGSGFVFGPRGVLLLRHRRLGIWVQPGGHLEPGEAPWEAARRETEEETGLHVEVVSGSDAPPPLAHVSVHPAADGHRHLDLRYLLAPVGADEPAPPVGESQEVRWCSLAEGAELADAELAAYLRHVEASSYTT